jgi:glycosyltransferase involved in cell wall biosynthesis
LRSSERLLMRITVGVSVHAEPDRLDATLAQLQRYSVSGMEVVLVPDGPDAVTAERLRSLSAMRQLGTETPRGGAACFNRLARLTDADIIVLLESGALVGPAWLERIVDALLATPANGLAGPSTNRAWNEQGILPHGRPTDEDVTRCADEAFRRFASQWRPLTPLHSLSDFCYAVRRDVVEALGGADEGYDVGPCWEMDYNIRAARAGFAGVWAMGAYVYRAPFTPRRARDEAQHFEASRRRYQDKFCGLRLRRERAEYERHCRGEACEHFAPTPLIQIHQGSWPRPAAPIALHDAPIVSCVMPTRGRADFVLRSIAYFQRQTVTAAELLILDDGPTDLSPQLPPDARVRYVRLPPGGTIGAKRNQGAQLARGRFLAHWDDDDWYAPQRLEAQLAPLLDGTADITALRAGVIFALPGWEFWRLTPQLHRRLFVQDVHGGTLVYRRAIWEGGARYPALSLGEDAHFLSGAMRHGARLTRLAGDELFVYVRHGDNSWRFACGRHLDPRGWLRVSEPELPAADREFYRTRSAAAPDSFGPAAPLVTCIMPTADRRAFVGHAIRYFLRQDYPATELLVLDDGDEPVADLIPADARIRYERLPQRMILGAKRNLAGEMARGDIVLHWDDDDWSAPDRVSRQVRALAADPGIEVCGLGELYFYDPGRREAWRYRYRGAGRRPWVAGNTMCYRRRTLTRTPFSPVGEGEDTRFVWALAPGQVCAIPDPTFFVAILHGRNTSARRRRDPAWSAVDVDIVRVLMQADIEAYDRWTEAGPSERALPHAPCLAVGATSV